MSDRLKDGGDAVVDSAKSGGERIANSDQSDAKRGLDNAGDTVRKDADLATGAASKLGKKTGETLGLKD